MADFQDLQAKLEPPRDLDALRIRIQEEVEIPHQKREQELEAEIAKFRKLYFEERRRREVSESKREQSETDRKVEIEASVKSKDNLIDTLRKQIDTLTGKLLRAHHTEDQDTSSLRAKVRAVRKQNAILHTIHIENEQTNNRIIMRPNTECGTTNKERAVGE